MNAPSSDVSSRPTRDRWFYFAASLALLIIMLIGFQSFYLNGKAYPDRPLTPPIRNLSILHGCLMTAWMALAVTQPLLIRKKKARLHRKLGSLGAVLSVGILVTGVMIGIGAARVNPPELKLFGMVPMEFLAIPLSSILMFGAFVALGVWYRHQPEVHRAMMLLASLSAVGAALGRIAPLNQIYAGTWLEVIFSAFLMQVLLAVLLLVVKWSLSRKWDRSLAVGSGAFTLVCILVSLGARTEAWKKVALSLTQ